MASLNKNLNNFFNNNKFLGSFQSFKDIPYSDIKKECCFIGRSNVGKSSLINSLTKTKKLAKTSKTPGRTQAINVFLLIDSKVGIKNSDIDMLDLLSDCSRKFSIILTKIDKISNNYLEYQKKSILSLMQNYEKSFTKIYQSETKKNNGITEIQRSIYGLSQ